MILQALCEYYDRKIDLGEMAPDGFIEKNIDFVVCFDENGENETLEDLRDPVGKRMVGKKYNVPAIGVQAQKHNNSGKDANLLWDNAAFALGMDDEKGTKLHSFIETIRAYYPEPPNDVKIVLSFLEDKVRVANLRDKAIADENYGKDMASDAPIVTFRVGNASLIVQCSHVAEALAAKPSNAPLGVCLVSGKDSVPIAPKHPVIKGVAGGQSSGCNLVSFNAVSFCSYGLEQSFNAPTGETSAEAYVKALQSLIDSGKSKVLLADTTIVFWAEREDLHEVEEVEDALWATFADPPKDDPDKGVRQVKGLLQSIESGKYIQLSGDFYVLGLSPNAARLSVRYWESGPVARFAKRIGEHFADFEVVRPKDDNREYLSLAQILRATAFEYKISNVAPNLAGGVVHAVLSGGCYPETLFAATVRRIRAERYVNRVRAAILKACINRKKRMNQEGEEIIVALDRSNKNIGYILGRLFAILEKIQDDALGPLNAGIRDRFYGAASTSPATVFPRLLNLNNHHMSKLMSENKGFAINAQNEMLEIMGEISDFPEHLALADQGRFAIGYYHERQDLFTSKKENKKEN